MVAGTLVCSLKTSPSFRELSVALASYSFHPRERKPLGERTDFICGRAASSVRLERSAANVRNPPRLCENALICYSRAVHWGAVDDPFHRGLQPPATVASA
jgi:hypothetical protein